LIDKVLRDSSYRARANYIHQVIAKTHGLDRAADIVEQAFQNYPDGDHGREVIYMRRYDYVIVGAGSAGCVLAARLSADPDVKVALLEARDEDSANEIRVPAATLQLAKTKYDWDFYSEAEPGLGGRSVPLAPGKGIGGTSSINAMVYIRGNPADFDNWERGGALGWSYREMLPYFIRGESNERGEDRFHGWSGPMNVQDARYVHPLSKRFIEAAK